MAAANELIMIFIGLEISSIASYILAGYLRDDKRNNEAALKYFLLGSFATAFLPLRRRADLRHHRHHQPGRRSARHADARHRAQRRPGRHRPRR